MTHPKTSLPEGCLSQSPTLHETAFIAPGAYVVGAVTLSEHSSVWYNAVLRADINAIHLGQRSNLQDGCVVHVENDRACTIGADVTVGHRAILHGCTLEDGCLVGMGAIVLNGAVVGRGAIVAAGAVVKEEMVIPPLTLVAGVPAKIIKTLDPGVYDTNLAWAHKYTLLAQKHKGLSQ